MKIPSQPLKPADFQAMMGVSNGVLERLEAYVALLRKWQPKVNLVANRSLKDVWRRHILDSAQLGPLLPAAGGVVADIGSGAGFPGMVLAIIQDHGTQDHDKVEIHLIESNGRKCAFLMEVNRITQAGAIIHHCRVENLPELKADVVTARGVASMGKLLLYANSVLKKEGQCLFLKGKKWREELTETKKNWIIKESLIPSLSEPLGMVVKLEEIRQRNDS